jgi:hypothetical protein
MDGRVFVDDVSESTVDVVRCDPATMPVSNVLTI